MELGGGPGLELSGGGAWHSWAGLRGLSAPGVGGGRAGGGGGGKRRRREEEEGQGEGVPWGLRKLGGVHRGGGDERRGRRSQEAFTSVGWAKRHSVGGDGGEELGVSGLRLGVGETLGAHSPLFPLGACWLSLVTSPDKHLYQEIKVNINSDKLG